MEKGGVEINPTKKVEMSPMFIFQEILPFGVFEEDVVCEKAEEERKVTRDAFRSLMGEAAVSGRISYSDFSREHGKDKWHKNIENSQERENIFNEFQVEVRRIEKEKEETRKQTMKDELKEEHRKKDKSDRSREREKKKKEMSRSQERSSKENKRERLNVFTHLS